MSISAESPLSCELRVVTCDLMPALCIALDGEPVGALGLATSIVSKCIEYALPTFASAVIAAGSPVAGNYKAKGVMPPHTGMKQFVLVRHDGIATHRRRIGKRDLCNRIKVDLSA